MNTTNQFFIKFLGNFLIIFFFLLPFKAFSYSSITVPIHDPVYRHLDKLVAHGLIKTMIKGGRPYGRSEIGRLIAEALENYPKYEARYRKAQNLSLKETARGLAAKVYVDRVLRQLKRQYHSELIQHGVLEGEVSWIEGRPLEYVQGDFLYLDAKPDFFPADNGLGALDAKIQPLVESRAGRRYQKGFNFSVETHHWFRATRFFSLQLEPRFQAQITDSDFDSETKLFIQRLNARLTVGKFELEVGRDSINWGFSNHGGLVFTDNSRSLDMLKISNIHPFTYPGPLAAMGLNQWSLVVANLGSDREIEYPWLVAYKMSNKNPFFEFGFTQSLLLGGKGAPNKSQRALSLEFLGRIAQARGLELYTEFHFSDFTSDFDTQMLDNTSYLLGAYMPRLDAAGLADLRIEYRRTAPRYARSPLYEEGLTQDRLLVGDPIGPDAQALTLVFLYEITPKSLISFDFQYTHRNSDRYQKRSASIQKVLDKEAEDRFRYGFGLKHRINDHLIGELGLGLEHGSDQGFVQGRDRFNWNGRVGIRWYWDAVAGI